MLEGWLPALVEIELDLGVWLATVEGIDIVFELSGKLRKIELEGWLLLLVAVVVVGTENKASELELGITLLEDEKENRLGIVIIWESHDGGAFMGKLAGGCGEPEMKIGEGV